MKAPESFQQGESNFEGTVSIVNIDVLNTLESKLKNTNKSYNRGGDLSIRGDAATVNSEDGR